MTRALVIIHDYGDTTGVLASGMLRRGFSLSWWCPKREAAPPRPAAGWGLVIGLGGSSDPGDPPDADWQAREEAFYREVLARRRPVLAICLSAQLMARALGARTWRLAQPNIGPERLALSPRAAPLFPEGFAAFQWHGCAFSLPQGAEQLATGPEGSCAAFRLGPTTLATQFHIEAPARLFETWMMENAASVADRRAALAREVAEQGPAIEAAAARAFEAWLDGALAAAAGGDAQP